MREEWRERGDLGGFGGDGGIGDHFTTILRGSSLARFLE